MKKVFLILVVIIGFGIMANAQDIILKKDASEIKAKVIEITDQQVKYKDFDYQNGPVRNVNISEVFMITYENGQKEVFNKPTEATPVPSKQRNLTNCAKKTAFGLDMGLGGSFLKINAIKSVPNFASSLGIRVMHHFNPYFGVDFIKINWITDVFTSKVYSGYLYTPYTMRLQFMPGIRGNSPAFLKCMSGYAAFRLGYGMDFGEFHFGGFCIETEIGLNLTSTIFAGFAYNYHNYIGYALGYEVAMHTLSFRLGFNFGK
jgi:hypothetical protein